MDTTFRPEAVDLFSYVLGGLFLTFLAAAAVWVITFVPSYIVSLACRCGDLWPAGNRAWMVGKVAAWATAITVASAFILKANGAIDASMVAGTGAGVITLAFFYALYTTPRTVRALRQEQEEQKMREVRWQQRDQHSLAG